MRCDGLIESELRVLIRVVVVDYGNQCICVPFDVLIRSTKFCKGACAGLSLIL